MIAIVSTFRVARRYATVPYYLKQSIGWQSSLSHTMSSLDISAIPAVDQQVSYDGKEYTTVKEGLAYILIPTSASKTPQTTPKGVNQAQSVFYNPIQQFNRDLSVLAIKAYGEEVMERKKRDATKSKEKLKTKQKEKKLKRKREIGRGDESRKTAKLENETTVGTTAITADRAKEGFNTQQVDKINGGLTVQEVAELSTELAQNEAIHANGLPGKEAEVLDTTKIPDSNDVSGIDTRNEVQDSEATQNPRQPTFTILDALSATGLRALRYAHEIPFTTTVTAKRFACCRNKNDRCEREAQ